MDAATLVAPTGLWALSYSFFEPEMTTFITWNEGRSRAKIERNFRQNLPIFKNSFICNKKDYQLNEQKKGNQHQKSFKGKIDTLLGLLYGDLVEPAPVSQQ